MNAPASLGRQRKPIESQAFRGFTFSERQIGGAYLDQLSPRPPRGARERRRHVRRDDQTCGIRHSMEEPHQLRIDAVVGDEMVVIEHKAGSTPQTRHCVRQPLKRPIQRKRLTAIGLHTIDRTRKSGGDLAYHLREANGVVVEPVERHPHERPVQMPTPLGQQSGLAESNRRSHHHEPASIAVKLLEKTRTEKRVRGDRRCFPFIHDRHFPPL